MKWFVLLLLVLIASISAAPEPTSVGRIIGGSIAVFGQIPYIASLLLLDHHICGSVIISATRVLTAARCIEDNPAEWFSILAGSLVTHVPHEPHERHNNVQSIQVSFYNKHPGYDPLTLDNNIAVMHLVSALDFSSAGVTAIGLPVQGAGVAVGTPATVSGWAKVSRDFGGFISKRYEVVTVISNDLCNTLNGGGITAGMICTGVSEGVSICQDNSGGPLEAGGVVIGVVGWRNSSTGPNQPVDYANVAYFRNWIDSN